MKWRLDTSLTTAANGQELARALLVAMQSDHVEIDFADVVVCTPSFANAFVMTVLEQVSIENFKARCALDNRRPEVAEILNRAAVRFQQGIRLSNQRHATVA